MPKYNEPIVWNYRYLAIIALVAAIVLPTFLVGIIWGWNTPLLEIRANPYLLTILLLAVLLPFWVSFRLVRIMDVEYQEEFSRLLDEFDYPEGEVETG